MAEDEDAAALDEFQREVEGRNLTFQVLSREPQVTRVLGFLTAQETTQLIAVGTHNLLPSTVYEGEQLTVMKYRTSETASIPDSELLAEPVLAGLNRRMGLLAGLSMGSSEDLQIARYTGENQGKYEPHMDWGAAGAVKRDFHILGGQDTGGRAATLLVFLDGEGARGGHTSFPELGLHVKPQAGAALLWFNLLPAAAGGGAAPQGDSRVRHGACPLLRGLKHIATKWIHEHGNQDALSAAEGNGGGQLERDWDGALAAKAVASRRREAACGASRGSGAGRCGTGGD